MRRVTVSAGAIALMILVLAATRDRWLPPEWNRDWHRTWLISPRNQGDPRDTIVEDHQARVEKIETEYRARIEAERQLHAHLQQRLEELKQSKEEP